jgi:hypothetical protein
MMGDYHVRFRERFRGVTPLYLLDIQTTSQDQDSLINDFFDETISVFPRQINLEHTNANS